MHNPHYQYVLQQLHQQTTVITPNNRLAKTLLEDYLNTSKQRTIAKPPSWSYEAFLNHLVNHHTHQKPHFEHPILLTKQQTQLFWSQQLHRQNQELPQGAIKQIVQAWSHCQLWEIDMKHPEWDGTDQTRQFRNWCTVFTEQLKKHNLMTIEQVVPYLISHDLQINIQNMIWFCFDESTPQQRSLQNYLTHQNVLHEYLDLAEQTTDVQFCDTPDEESELLHIIQWLQTQLAKPYQHIGVVVPDLNKKSSRFNRLLQQHFSSDCFNISLGKTLADHTLVSHALTFLAMNKNILPQEQAALLLHSPFLTHSKQEMSDRMACLQNNPLLQERRIHQGMFIRSIESQAPKLAKALNSISAYPKETTPLIWANLFQTRLGMLGFPGEYSLDSNNYQCYQRLLLLFDEFKQLNIFSPMMTRDQALQSLKQLATTTIFQPEKGTATPIHILGLLEAAGCQFDALWISHMTDNCLPQKTQFSAFIPISLQKRHHLPYTDPEREYTLAEQTLNRFQRATNSIIFSYPKHTDDQHNLPTPLLQAITPHALNQPTPNESAQGIYHQETYIEDYHLPCTPENPPSGNTALLGNQAKCPFRAFSAHRLHLKRNQTLSEGLNAREKGIIIHQIMELFWDNVKDQDSLLTLSEEILSAIIDAAIATAIKPYQHLRRYSFSSVIQHIEKERLNQLIHACLIWEKNRPPFTIKALEKTHTLHVGPIDFTVRVDRIDNVSPNEEWVIDYKTRLPYRMPWYDDTFTEPQLLLYALLNDSIQTILFAELKNGHMNCKGLSEVDPYISGIKSIRADESWKMLKMKWREQLETLAQSFYDGKCVPEPFNNNICGQCEYRDVCRLPFE